MKTIVMLKKFRNKANIVFVFVLLGYVAMAIQTSYGQEAIKNGHQTPTYSLGPNPPIVDLSEKGDLEKVTLVLQNGGDVNSRGAFGRTALHLASACGHEDIVNLLLRANADINAVDEFEETPLFFASRVGDIKIVKLLIDAKCDTDLKNTSGETSLFCAIHYSDNIEVVNCLINTTTEINCYCKDGMTALHQSSKNGKYKFAKALIDAKAGPNLVDKGGNTALHYAAFWGNVNSVKVLLDAHCELSVRNNINLTAFDYISGNDRKEKYQLFLKAGATTGIALSDAVLHSDIQTTEREIEICENVNVETALKGRTPLYYAIQIEDVEKIDLLINKKADTSVRDDLGDTVLHQAVRLKNPVIVKKLIDSRTDINAQNFDLETPIMLAVRCKDWDTIKLLIESGADISIKDVKGRTPFNEIEFLSGIEDKLRLDMIRCLQSVPVQSSCPTPDQRPETEAETPKPEKK